MDDHLADRIHAMRRDLPRLVRFADHSDVRRDPEAVAHVVNHMHRRGTVLTEGAVALLVRLTAHDAAEVRRAVYLVLFWHADRVHPSDLLRGVDDDDPEVRKLAASALCRMDRATAQEALARAALSPDVKVRRAVAYAIRPGTVAGDAALLTLAHDRDARVRRWAERNLADGP